jgi:predicted metalloprotease
MSAGGAAVPMGIGGVLLLLVLSWFTGVDFLSLLGGGGNAPYTDSQPTGTGGTVAASPEEERMVDFVDAVMADTQGTWGQLMQGYQPTTAVLFRSAVESTCGFAQSAVGPFYCPADRKVYLDLSFFNELRTRFGAPGDFAQAYVLAHEVGHHVQTVTGTERRVRQLQQSNPGQQNELSVRMELQADCYAGVWGHVASQSGRAQQGRVELEAGDLEEGLRAASAIGDDTLQKRANGRVMPDKFTHGSSAQRVEWFRRGFDSGDPNACNTFQ